MVDISEGGSAARATGRVPGLLVGRMVCAFRSSALSSFSSSTDARSKAISYYKCEQNDGKVITNHTL